MTQERRLKYSKAVSVNDDQKSSVNFSISLLDHQQFEKEAQLIAVPLYKNQSQGTIHERVKVPFALVIAEILGPLK